MDLAPYPVVRMDMDKYRDIWCTIIDYTAEPLTPYPWFFSVENVALIKEAYKTLSALALLSRVCTSGAKRHLYKHVFLSTRNGLERFAKTLEGSPEIGALVERLCVYLIIAFGWSNEDMGEEPDDINIPFPAHLAGRLSAIKRATFGHDYAGAPTAFQALIEAIVRQPTLATLQLHNFDCVSHENMYPIVWCSPNLRKIKLDHLVFETDHWNARRLDPQGFPGCCTNLTVVKTSYMESEDLDFVLSLFQGARALKKLEIWPKRGDNGIYTAMSHYPRLEELRLGINWRDNHVAWISRALAAVTHNCPKNIIISFSDSSCATIFTCMSRMDLDNAVTPLLRDNPGAVQLKIEANVTDVCYHMEEHIEARFRGFLSEYIRQGGNLKCVLCLMGGYGDESDDEDEDMSSDGEETGSGDESQGTDETGDAEMEDIEE